MDAVSVSVAVAVAAVVSVSVSVTPQYSCSRFERVIIIWVCLWDCADWPKRLVRIIARGTCCRDADVDVDADADANASDRDNDASG